jgi:RNase P/RNase MRP subunit POP5
MKIKIKALRPSLREKKRYVVFKAVGKDINLNIVSNLIINKFKELYGTYGLGKAGIMFLENRFNYKEKKGVLRVNNLFVDYVKSVFLFIDNHQQNDLIVSSVYTSGSLKKALQYIN